MTALVWRPGLHLSRCQTRASPSGAAKPRRSLWLPEVRSQSDNSIKAASRKTHRTCTAGSNFLPTKADALAALRWRRLAHALAALAPRTKPSHKAPAPKAAIPTARRKLLKHNACYGFASHSRGRPYASMPGAAVP